VQTRPSERKEGLLFMHSDTDRLWGEGADDSAEGTGAELPPVGSVEYINRSLAASSSLCRPGSLVPGVIDAHLAVVNSGDSALARRMPGQNF
jgi:hypothetical protein